jgi:PAS domain-containing protein
MTHVGNTSNIILDPDLDTYYMQDMLLRILPEARTHLVAAAALGDNIIASGAGSPQDKASLSLLAGLLNSSAGNTKDGATTAFNNNPAGNLKPQVETRLNDYLSSVEAFATTAEAQLAASSQQPAAISSETWLNSADKALDANYDLWASAVGPFDDLLTSRVNGFTQRRNLTLAVTAGVVLIVAYLWIGFYVAVMRTASTLKKASTMLETGGTVEALKLEGNDEVSRMAAASLTKIAAAANELNTTIDERTNELTEVAAVLAHHHDGIIITDERGVVKVLNGAATQLLFTNFDVAVGRSLIELVRDPKVQELLRAALLTPGQHQAIDLSIGNRIVLMVAKFIPVTEAQLTGLITMQDVTEVRRLQHIGQNGAMAMAR